MKLYPTERAARVAASRLPGGGGVVLPYGEGWAVATVAELTELLKNDEPDSTNQGNPTDAPRIDDAP